MKNVRGSLVSMSQASFELRVPLGTLHALQTMNYRGMLLTRNAAFAIHDFGFLQ